MTLIHALVLGADRKLPFRRMGWTHADWIVVKGDRGAYGDGELWWKKSETRCTLFYVNDVLAMDWEIDWEKPDEANSTI